MAKLRLDKLLADTGRWSRKEARELARQGRVRVNGTIVKKSEEKVETDHLLLEVDGILVTWQHFTYLMMNKPAGVLTATRDRREKTVLDLLPQEYQRQELRPVGRLDKDTEGLLLLTNDGELSHRLLAPKSHVDKVYYAEIDGTVDEADVRAFAEGMTLEDDGLVCQSAQLRSLGEGRCEVTLREGKFHQVKRMLAQRGKPVRYLKRVAMGSLTLDDSLEKGQFRPLSETELAGLRGTS
jgi:16S rRNA pseudouridine516 synthase